MERLALRLGYRPREWEHLQPVELWSMRKAHEWRRDREIEVVATGVHFLVAAAGAKVSHRTILKAFPDYGNGDEEA